jgi:hypothetical protein
MVATRRSASPSLSEESTINATTTTTAKTVLATEVPQPQVESKGLTVNALRQTVVRRKLSKPKKNLVKGTSHIHFHKKTPTVNKKGVPHSSDVLRVKLLTGTLFIHKGRKAEFIRLK